MGVLLNSEGLYHTTTYHVFLAGSVEPLVIPNSQCASESPASGARWHCCLPVAWTSWAACSGSGSSSKLLAFQVTHSTDQRGIPQS